MGKDEKTKQFKTKIAEPYPQALCADMAKHIVDKIKYEMTDPNSKLAMSNINLDIKANSSHFGSRTVDACPAPYTIPPEGVVGTGAGGSGSRRMNEPGPLPPDQSMQPAPSEVTIAGGGKCSRQGEFRCD